MASADLQTTFERLLQRREATIMSTAERLRREGMEAGLAQGLQQGLQQGLTEGRTEGRAEVLLRLMARRCGELSPDTVARIRRASMPELDLWTDRVLEATSPSEVFAS